MNQAGRSEAMRDITEPGWREREAKMTDWYLTLPAREDLCGGAPAKLGDGLRRKQDGNKAMIPSETHAGCLGA